MNVMLRRVPINEGLRKAYELGIGGLMIPEANSKSFSTVSQPNMSMNSRNKTKSSGREPETQPEQVDHPWWKSRSLERLRARAAPEDEDGPFIDGRAVENAITDHLVHLFKNSNGGLKPGEVPVSLYDVCIRHFGSWNASLERLNLGSSGSSNERKLTKDEVLAWAADEVQECRKIPFPRQSPIPEEWVALYFGSWSRMLEEVNAWDVILDKFPVTLDSPKEFISKVVDTYLRTKDARKRNGTAPETCLAAAISTVCFMENIPVAEREVRQLVQGCTRRVNPLRAWEVRAVLKRLETKEGLELPPHTILNFVERGFRGLSLLPEARERVREVAEALDKQGEVPERLKPAAAAVIIYALQDEVLEELKPTAATVITYAPKRPLQSKRCHRLKNVLSACGASPSSVLDLYRVVLSGA